MPNIERRYHEEKPTIELRDNGQPVIIGHAAVFDQLSVNLGGFREKVRRGAFAKTLKNADVRALMNHEPNRVLGRNRSGTLRLEEDDIGLAVEIEPPDTQWAKDDLVSIKRGDITQMSFGFRTVKDEWYEDRDTGVVTRELVEVELFDVSPVTFPAYPQTDVGLRSVIWSDENFGIDLVTRALYRAQIGGLEEEDLEVLQRLQAFSQQFATEPGQAPGSQSQEDESRQAPDFEAMRRHLEILEIE